MAAALARPALNERSLSHETWVGLGLATLSGCAWFLACAPFDLSALAWVAMIPVLFALDRASSTGQAVFFSWWAGAVLTAGQYYWLIELLRRFADFSTLLAILGYLLFCAYQGSIFLLFGLVVRTIRSRRKLPMVLVAPPAMVMAELVVPLLFPSSLAMTQAWRPVVIQIADLAGPLGVTAVLLVVNAALYDLLTERRKAVWPALAGAAVLVAALLYGYVRMRHVDALTANAPKLEVGLVQPNVAFNLKGVEHPEQAQAQLRVLRERSRELADAGAQLIVWSETSFPYILPRNFVHDFPAGSPYAMRPGFDTPLIVGALTRSPSDVYAHNSALMLDRDGRVTGRYDKVLLLAFGEYMPGVEYFPSLRKWIPAGAGNYTPGDHVDTVPFTDRDGRAWRLGTIICYEDILPEFLRRVGALHPDLLVNLTNDTWFGEKSEPWEHLSLAVFASVEQRTALVRAVNSGVSAVVDANGRVTSKTYALDPYVHPRPAGKMLATVALMEGGHTVYQAVGNLFAYLCTAASLLTWGAVYLRSPQRVR